MSVSRIYYTNACNCQVVSLYLYVRKKMFMDDPKLCLHLLTSLCPASSVFPLSSVQTKVRQTVLLTARGHSTGSSLAADLTPKHGLSSHHVLML